MAKFDPDNPSGDSDRNAITPADRSHEVGDTAGAAVSRWSLIAGGLTIFLLVLDFSEGHATAFPVGAVWAQRVFAAAAVTLGSIGAAKGTSHFRIRSILAIGLGCLSLACSVHLPQVNRN